MKLEIIARLQGCTYPSVLSEGKFSMSGKARHVVPNPKGGWSVRHSGASRASKVFEKQADAVKYATETAKKERAELYVHRRDGTIRRKDTYGRDPFPPRDQR